MASKHYIAMAGLHGYMPQCCEAFADLELAAGYLAAIHELSSDQAETLARIKHLELDVHEYGNEYCEIQECKCEDPGIHCDSGVYDEP